MFTVNKILLCTLSFWYAYAFVLYSLFSVCLWWHVLQKNPLQVWLISLIAVSVLKPLTEIFMQCSHVCSGIKSLVEFFKHFLILKAFWDEDLFQPCILTCLHVSLPDLGEIKQCILAWPLTGVLLGRGYPWAADSWGLAAAHRAPPCLHGEISYRRMACSSTGLSWAAGSCCCMPGAFPVLVHSPWCLQGCCSHFSHSTPQPAVVQQFSLSLICFHRGAASIVHFLGFCSGGSL